jgi:putative pyruvate formate lyase activating enzyme
MRRSGGLPGERDVLIEQEPGMVAWESSYLALYRSGELRRRAREAMASLAACELCPHACKVDRLSGKHGVCRMAGDAVIASWNVHPWEEPPISGTRGSGTIFFSGCTGRCRFCQNYSISQMGYGNRVSIERFAGMMLELQRRGAHNINFVTPTHFAAHILAAVEVAAGWGLRIPLVYNTSGYERVDTLRLLDGVIDIYLPDIKYASDEIAKRLSGFPRYVEHDRLAVKEMLRQVGPQLLCDEEGVARRGMIIRHLVLPDGLADTPGVMRWIGGELSRDVSVSVMDQYFPTYRTVDDPVLGRKITEEEYEAALEAFEAAGLQNGWLQDHKCESL